MISERLAIDHAKSECSAYGGATILRDEMLAGENVKDCSEKNEQRGTVKFARLVPSAAKAA
jgi:hypothetical protein